jgi:alpha-tubulin suppressor-like RCC1 family protein
MTSLIQILNSKKLATCKRWVLILIGISTFLTACPGEDKKQPQVQSIRLTPEVVSIAAESNITLTATVIGAENTGVTWSVVGKENLLSKQTPNSTVFFAPGGLNAKTEFQVKATSVIDPTKSAEANVEVIPTVYGIWIESNRGQLLPNQSTSLSTYVSGSDSDSVQWKIISGRGSLSKKSGASVQFTAPLAASEEVTTIEVQSKIDLSKVASLSIETRPHRSKFSANDYHGLAIDDKGVIHAWGNNDFGALGTGGTQDEFFPAPINIPTMGLAVAAGGFHSLGLGQNGILYSWGDNQDGALGIENIESTLTPKEVPLVNVSQIAAGTYHSLALNRDGDLYSWGLNNDGQLGINEPTQKVVKPTRIAELKNVVAIAAKGSHSAALLENGSVYVWGDNAATAPENQPGEDQFSPRKLENLDNIVSIQLGTGHGMALNAQGEVFTWGLNEFKATGHNNGEYISAPQKLEAFSGIQHISAGSNHSLVVDQLGDLYAWGADQFGQLGMTPGPASFQLEPVRVLPNVTTIESGANASFAISQGQLFGWGSNAFGQLGLGFQSTYALPQVVMEKIAFP